MTMHAFEEQMIHFFKTDPQVENVAIELNKFAALMWKLKGWYHDIRLDIVSYSLECWNTAFCLNLLKRAFALATQFNANNIIEHYSVLLIILAWPGNLFPVPMAKALFYVLRQKGLILRSKLVLNCTLAHYLSSNHSFILSFFWQ